MQGAEGSGDADLTLGGGGTVDAGLLATKVIQTVQRGRARTVTMGPEPRVTKPTGRRLQRLPGVL